MYVYKPSDYILFKSYFQVGYQVLISRQIHRKSCTADIQDDTVVLIVASFVPGPWVSLSLTIPMMTAD